MNYLAIDASTEACSVALQVNDQIYSRYELCPQSHSLRLLPMIDAVLAEANVTLSTLNGLIFGQGPGSFTGVRIGVGVAQGLAFAADLPVVGVSSLQAMAQQAYSDYGEKQVIAAIDARMAEVYNGFFQLDEHNIMQAQQAEAVTPPAKLGELLAAVIDKPSYAVGSGWDAYPEALAELKRNANSPTILFPSATAMLDVGAHKFSLGLGVSAEHAQPVYVRDTVSWKKLPGKT